MKVALTVEGQRGLTWEHWKNFVPRVEECGYAGLYRSDHFVDAEPPDLDSLELWVSLTWAVDHTRRIELGSLVTPFSFRHPVHTARMAKELDNLSTGRFVLGVGAGWEGGAREHHMFGFDLLSVQERFLRFQEGLEVVTRLLKQTGPVSFDGNYYQLRQARLLPAPARQGGPFILVGGNGMNKVLMLAARYADEWNAIHRTPEQFSALNGHLDQLLDEAGRDRKSVRRSVMTALYFSETQAGLEKLLGTRHASALWERGVLVGCAAQVLDQIHALAQAGVEKVIIQWPDLTNFDLLESFSRQVLSKVENQ
jgi:alkanesulfonate monooxygenase SsuD/methylene tetrahydromethanopterin reductase-like flavin-dependent oxidoreductase (luciferase family)